MDDDAWQSLRSYREDAAGIDGADIIQLVGEKTRSKITQKLSLKNAIETIIEENRGRIADQRSQSILYLALNIPGAATTSSGLRLKTTTSVTTTSPICSPAYVLTAPSRSTASPRNTPGLYLEYTQKRGDLRAKRTGGPLFKVLA